MIEWYWVKIKGEWSPAVRDKNAAGGWTNLDTWEDFHGEVTEFVRILPPNKHIEPTTKGRGGSR